MGIWGHLVLSLPPASLCPHLQTTSLSPSGCELQEQARGRVARRGNGRRGGAWGSGVRAGGRRPWGSGVLQRGWRGEKARRTAEGAGQRRHTAEGAGRGVRVREECADAALRVRTAKGSCPSLHPPFLGKISGAPLLFYL